MLLKIGSALVGVMLLFAASTQLQYFDECTSRTAGNATLIIPEDVYARVGDHPLRKSDEIAAFTDGEVCMGATGWKDESFALTIWETSGHEINPDDNGDGSFHLHVWRSDDDAVFSTKRDSARISFSDDEAFLKSEPVYSRNAIFVLDSLIIEP